MKQLTILITFSFVIITSQLISMQMDHDTKNSAEKSVFIDLENECLVQDIKTQQDPTKFLALLTKFVANNKRRVHEFQKQNESHQEFTKIDELNIFKEVFKKIEEIKCDSDQTLSLLANQALDPCNKERKKGLAYTLGWGSASLVLLGLEGYVLLAAELPTQGQISAGVPLGTMAFSTMCRFFDHFQKAIMNEHINEKIICQTQKMEAIQRVREQVQREIELLNKEIKGDKSLNRLKNKKNKISQLED